jgi:acyl-[acyl carrier protein]--UDP-N-acetylglucosamine O-acyltransferase
MIRTSEYIRLGKDCKIDKTAVIGYMPSRQLKDLTLIIGDQSVIRSGTVIYLGSKIGN